MRRLILILTVVALVLGASYATDAGADTAEPWLERIDDLEAQQRADDLELAGLRARVQCLELRLSGHRIPAGHPCSTSRRSR